MKKILGIYHSDDLDGLMSGAIQKYWAEKLNDYQITSIGYNYGEELPEELFNQDWDQIILSDISFPKPIMKELKDRYGENFIWYDHHKRTIDDMKDLNINGIQNPNYSAQEITYMDLISIVIPNLIEWFGLYDTFRHKNTADEEDILFTQLGGQINIGLDFNKAYDVLLNIIKNIQNDFDIVNNFKEQGKIVFKYKQDEAQSVLNKFSYDKEIEGKLFLTFNKDRMNLANYLDQDKLDELYKKYYGFCSYYYSPSLNGFRVSLYTDENMDRDVSEIAKVFGGGGHKGASGFQTKDVKLLMDLK